MTGAVALLSVSACAPPDDNSVETRRIDDTTAQESRSIAGALSSIAQEAVANDLVEGIQFAFIDGTEIVSAEAFGLANREQQVPMTVDTLINVASISKSLTAWGMLAFLEDNNLDLDASARGLIVEKDFYDEVFPDVDVSIRMLLSHTSGLAGASVPVLPATEPIPQLNDIVLGRSSVPRARLRERPGTGFSYSGAGYLILQKIIEDQTGGPFADYMSDAVLDPLQMSDSTFALTREMLSDVAIYYRGDGRRREPYQLPGAAGALYSTARDMARFLAAYMAGGQETRRRVVSDQGYFALLNPEVVATEEDPRIRSIRYSLGHYTYETPEGANIVFHSGGNPGLRSLFLVCQDRDIALFSVANSDNGSEVIARMMRAWGDHYGLTLHEYF